MEGKGAAELVEGFIKNAGEGTQTMLKQGIAAIEVLTGKDVTPDAAPVIEAKSHDATNGQ
jgi:hypothetical protein